MKIIPFIKSLLPEAWEYILSIPLPFRVIILMIIPLTAGSLFNDHVYEALAKPVEFIPINAMIGLLFLIFIALIVLPRTEKYKKDKALINFCREWLNYLNFLIPTIEETQSLDESNTTQLLQYLDPSSQHIKDFQKWNYKMRRLFYKIDEDILISNRNKYWQSIILKGTPFKDLRTLHSTPFSFILDQQDLHGLAVAYKREIFPSINISTEIIEILAAEHPSIENLWNNYNKERIE